MVSPSPDHGHGRAESRWCDVRLWQEGFLSWRLADVAENPRRLSHDEEAARRRRPGAGMRVLLGDAASNGAPGDSRADALPSPGADGEAARDCAIHRQLQAGRQVQRAVGGTSRTGRAGHRGTARSSCRERRGIGASGWTASRQGTPMVERRVDRSMNTTTELDIQTVRSFWDEKPCQADLSQAADRRRYFEEITEKRYGRREWHIPIVARFDSFRDKDVVEIGCGIATDGLEFARRGARYIGTDLTTQGIELAKERFALFGVPARFEVADASERLPLDDASVDHVYSFGVIHHAPSPEKIAREMHRVLRPGGTFTVMLYNRPSINYYVEIMFLRKVFRWVLLPAFMPGLLASITGFDRWKLEGHRALL